MEARKKVDQEIQQVDPSYLLTLLLGILSPQEINNLTITDESIVKDSSTSILELEVLGLEGDVGQAKILPFKQSSGPSVEVQDDCIDLLSDDDFHGHEDIIIEEGDKNDPQALFKKKKVRVEKKMDMTTFIIREKRKLQASQKKLKERQILESYKKNASIDIEEEKKLKEDLSKSSKLGVLINKRQY